MRLFACVACVRDRCSKLPCSAGEAHPHPHRQAGMANMQEALSRRLQAAEAEVSRKERMGWDIGSISSISNESHSNASSVSASPLKEKAAPLNKENLPPAARRLGATLPELLKQAASLEALGD